MRLIRASFGLSGRLRWRVAAVMVWFVLGGCLAKPVTAASSNPAVLSCQQLWFERNSILKSGGYCFVGKREIDAFSNEGCVIRRESDVPMSSDQRRRMALILIAERQKLCR